MLLAFFYCGEMLPFPHLIACDDKTNYLRLFRRIKNDKSPGVEQMFQSCVQDGIRLRQFSVKFQSENKWNPLVIAGRLLGDVIEVSWRTRHWTHTICFRSLRPNFVDMRRRLDSHLHVHGYQAVTTAATMTQTQDFSLQLSWSRFSS